MKLGRLVLRVTLGVFFVGHGTQKLFGWFGGPGHAGTAGWMESIGLRPGKVHATAAGAAEAGGGVLLAAGLATPAAAASISGVMLTAIHRVHWKNGPWSANGGYEYNTLILASLFALVESGPGPWSLDAALGIERRGSGWALAALGAGAAGAALAAAASKPAQLPPAEADETVDGTADEPTTAEREAAEAETPT